MLKKKAFEVKKEKRVWMLKKSAIGEKKGEKRGLYVKKER